MEHVTGIKGVLVVDVVARRPYRHLEVYGEEFQLSWNGTADSLVEFDVKNKKTITYTFENASEHVEGYASFITENQYRDEIKAFLTQIKDPTKNATWDFERDAIILDIIDQIEA